ncbi:Nicotinamidase/pyrazinamidase [Mycolicibacterium aubagnense]
MVGIATNYCVKATAADAVQAGFRTRVLLDYTAGVSAEGAANAVAALKDSGVTVTHGP